MRPLKIWILVTILSLGLCVALLACASEAQARGPVQAPFLGGEIWIKPSAGTSLSTLESTLSLPDASLEPGTRLLEWIRVKVPVGREEEYLSKLRAEPHVLDATLNHVAHVLEIPNDERWDDQWNMHVIEAAAAWDIITDTTDVTVAIVDTGVDIGHPDIEANLWTNTGEISGNGLDDDGNGYVDDANGWNFVGQDADVMDRYLTSGHGTHVAGIIGAMGDNGIGVAGLSWNGTIMPVRVLDEQGEGDYADIARGVNYAAENGARIINLSLGGTASSPLLYDAVLRARGRGCLVVAAAGNCADQMSLYDEACNFQINPPFYPAAHAETLAVAATNGLDRWADFSEHHDYVDLSAPGTGICSTCLQGDYCFKQGTSMATPHVAGLAALIWTARPELTNQEVQRVMEGWAADVNSDERPGKDKYLGWGRINAYQAVLNASRGPALTVRSSRQTLQVGATQATVTVTMTNEYGYGPDGTPVTFTTTLGYVFPPTTALTEGTATTTLTAGSLSGVAHLTAECDTISGTMTLHILPGEPHSVAVACNPSRIDADSGTATVVATVSDRFGNAVADGTDVYMATTLGSIYPARVQTYEGRATAHLTGQGQGGIARITADAITAAGWTEAVLHAHVVDLPIIQKLAWQADADTPPAPGLC